MKSQNEYSKIKSAISAIEEEISRKELPTNGPMSLPQLKEFRQTLYQMREVLLDQNNSWQRQRTMNMGKIIVDSWPLDSKLGEIIIQAEDEFQKSSH